MKTIYLRVRKMTDILSSVHEIKVSYQFLNAYASKRQKAIICKGWNFALISQLFRSAGRTTMRVLNVFINSKLTIVDHIDHLSCILAHHTCT